MRGWVWHESRDENDRLRPIPRAQKGQGWNQEQGEEPGKDFKRDEKTGLLLPASAAKARRKVKIGFQA